MIKKLCIVAGLAGITGCYTPVRTAPVMTTPAYVAPATSTIIYTEPAPLYVAPAWGFGPRWHHGWGFGPGFHHHHHGRCR